MPWIFKSPLSL